MNKTTQIIIGTIVVIIILAGIWYGVSKNPIVPTTKEPIKIGAILPLSGGFAFVGKAIQQGMELALQDYPESNLRIIYEDDQSFNSTAAVNAVNKLVNIDGVHLVFNSVVATIKAIAPVLNEKQTVGIVVWDSNKTIANLGSYIFGMGYSTERAGEKMASFAYYKLGVKTAAVVAAYDEWSEIISSSFIDKFKNLGGRVDLHEEVKLEENDFRSIIAKIKNKKSESIYVPLYGSALDNFLKQTKEAGYKGFIFSADGFTDMTIKNVGEAAEGVYVTQLWISDQTLLEKYKSKYGQEIDPINLNFVALGYDSIKLVAELSKNIKAKGKAITKQAIYQELVGFRMKGFTGETAFSASRITDKEEPILIVKNRKFELIEK
jgi:branched-chain amino acid transport system substrate-binding protein